MPPLMRLVRTSSLALLLACTGSIDAGRPAGGSKKPPTQSDPGPSMATCLDMRNSRKAISRLTKR